MRTLALNKQAENKVGDTATTWYFTLSDDGNAVSTVGDTLTAHIKNNTGYLIDVPVTSTNNGLAQVSFNNKSIEQLPSGEYLLEIDLVNTDGTVAKYPTDGFFPFQLNLNAMSTTRELVTEITFQQVLDGVDEKIKTELATGDYKGPKGDDAYLHVAYANSADGSTDFSRQGNENLLTGTTNALTTVNNVSSWGTNLPSLSTNRTDLSNNTYTASMWLSPVAHDAAIYMRIVKTDGSASGGSNSSVVKAGTSGYSVLTCDVPSDSYIFSVWPSFTADQTDSTTVSYKEMKLEKGAVATDWCPAPADNKPYHYMGTYADNTATGSTNSSDYTWLAPLTLS